MTSDARRRRALGIGLALTSAASFGVMPVLTKVVYDDGAEPVGVLTVRFALAAAVLLVLARVRRQPLPRGHTLGTLTALGALGYVGMSLCYFFALERISAGLTALLLYFYPALVVVLGALLLRNRQRPAAFACVAVATVGTVLTIGPVGGGQALGVALGERLGPVQVVGGVVVLLAVAALARLGPAAAEEEVPVPA